MDHYTNRFSMAHLELQTKAELYRAMADDASLEAKHLRDINDHMLKTLEWIATHLNHAHLPTIADKVAAAITKASAPLEKMLAKLP